MKQEDFINWSLQNETSEISEYKDIKIITYLIEDGQPALKIWKGRQSKPFLNYKYTNLESRENAIATHKASADSREEYKLKRKAERAAFIPNFEVGDIFVSSWGYDQTNVDFFQVTEKIGNHTGLFRPIGMSSVDGSEGFMSHCVVPNKNQFIGDEIKRRVGKYGISINSVSSAKKWDGRPKYNSWYA